MKPAHLIPILLLVSCSTDIAELPITLRSDINYITYNPEIACTGQPVTVTFNNGYQNNCGISRIQQRINNIWTVVKEDIPQDGIISYSFTPHTAGNYRFRASWNKSGKNCPGENIKHIEEDPLGVVDGCCRDYFTVNAICDSGRDCPYGLEFNMMITMDNWLTLIGQLPAGYEFCGLYDEFGNIVEEFSGNTFEIGGDFYACTAIKFYIYFNTPVNPPVFGSWMLKDMNGVLYRVEPEGCDGS